MKYLGIDYGKKMVGIAISDDDGRIAFPRAVVPNDEKLLTFVARKVAEEKIATIVVGDTRTVSGEENPVTKEADAFINAIAQTTAVHVERVFEAWSSKEASRYAPKGEEHNDGAAAAIILQRFLDMRGRSDGHSPEHE